MCFFIFVSTCYEGVRLRVGIGNAIDSNVVPMLHMGRLINRVPTFSAVKNG